MLLLMTCVVLTLLAAPETPAGRFLHRHLVVALTARLNRITRGQILLATLLCGLVMLVTWLLQGDGLAMLGMAAPETTIWLISVEASSYLDVLAGIMIAASTVRVRGFVAQLRGLRRGAVRRPTGVRRARRTARPMRPDASNDDDRPAPFVAMAFAAWGNVGAQGQRAPRHGPFASPGWASQTTNANRLDAAMAS